MKKAKKTNIITLIIIPLLVTALWEKLLGPLFDISLTWLSAFGGEFLQANINIIYIYIATGRPVDTSWFLFIIVASLMLARLLMTASESIKSYKKLVEVHNKLTNPSDERHVVSAEKLLTDSEKMNRSIQSEKKFSRFCVILTACGYIAYLLYVLVVGYINTTITKLTNNIEIVAPYVDDFEYKSLKSAFYSMEGADDYHSLITELNHIAETNGVKLKD